MKSLEPFERDSEIEKVQKSCDPEMTARTRTQTGLLVQYLNFPTGNHIIISLGLEIRNVHFAAAAHMMSPSRYPLTYMKLMFEKNYDFSRVNHNFQQ